VPSIGACGNRESVTYPKISYFIFTRASPYILGDPNNDIGSSDNPSANIERLGIRGFPRLTSEKGVYHVTDAVSRQTIEFLGMDKLPRRMWRIHSFTHLTSGRLKGTASMDEFDVLFYPQIPRPEPTIELTDDGQCDT